MAFATFDAVAVRLVIAAAMPEAAIRITLSMAEIRFRLPFGDNKCPGGHTAAFGLPVNESLQITIAWYSFNTDRCEHPAIGPFPDHAISLVPLPVPRRAPGPSAPPPPNATAPDGDFISPSGKSAKPFLVSTPAECYSKFQVDLTRQFADTTVAVINLSDGTTTYLPLPESFGRDVYQARIAFYQPDALARVTKMATEAMIGMR